ncbi:MAG: helix-turn-helix transcriptional regulator [Oligoflexia bacterium]|nr:helix-turn-helix transcriptional regulator [Oligoflexia bacterium]
MSTKKNRSTDAVFREMLGHVSFGEVLESERISLGLTQTVFAKKLGISKQELCDIEKGRRSISLVSADFR